MKITKLFYKSSKYYEENQDTETEETTRRLIKANFIKRDFSGVYYILPLGLRVIEKINTIVEEELKRIGFNFLIAPTIQKADKWELTGRDQIYGEEIFKIISRDKGNLLLSPTAEESMLDLVSSYFTSYKDLPVLIAQNGKKYRYELRPTNGLIRTLELLMIDAYSFHEDKEELEDYYLKVYNAYINIFNKLDLKVKVIKAECGEIGGLYSHEFRVVTRTFGEIELLPTEDSKLDNINSDSNNKEEYKSIEVAHIFNLGDRYSKPLNKVFKTSKNELSHYLMACFGIGTSRLLQVVADVKNIWPMSITPYHIYLIGLMIDELEDHYEVLHDDRDISFGIKMNDVDIIGIPILIISKTDYIEIRNNNNKEKEIYNRDNNLINKIISFIKKNFS